MRGLFEAIQQLELDENLRRKLSRGALLRAKDFTREEKVQVINRIYRAKAAIADMTDLSNS